MKVSLLMENFQKLYNFFLLVAISLIVLSNADLYRANEKIMKKLDLMKPHEFVNQETLPHETVLHRGQTMPYKLFINWSDIFFGEGSYRLNSDFQNRSSEPVVIFKTNFGANHSIPSLLPVEQVDNLG
jgi:hypothetical protein